MDLTVVIPVYNSSDRLVGLGEFLVRMLSQMPILFEIILVDDGSTDASAATIERMHGRHKQVKGIFMKRNIGQHAAVFMGLRLARGRHILLMDDDMLDALDIFPVFWQKIVEGRDVVSGNRNRCHGTTGVRPIFSRGINLVISLIAGHRFQDATSPFKLFCKDLVGVLIDGGMLDLLVPEYLMMKGHNVEEVALPGTEPTGTCSRYTWRKLLQHGLTFFRTLLFAGFSSVSATFLTPVLRRQEPAYEVRMIVGF